MAKTAAALHILVKEEALAKEILAKLAKGGNVKVAVADDKLTFIYPDPPPTDHEEEKVPEMVD